MLEINDGLKKTGTVNKMILIQEQSCCYAQEAMSLSLSQLSQYIFSLFLKKVFFYQ